jgi:YaiO family outer membrane protein
MKFAYAICGAALLASAAAAEAETAALPATTSGPPGEAALAPRLIRAHSNLHIEYTDYSKLYGDRAVLTADSRLGIGSPTRFTFSLSQGQRRAPDHKSRATRAEAGVGHDWTDRLTTHTSVSLATNGSVFAKKRLSQDVSYEVAKGLVGTVGGEYSSYGNRNTVTNWSAGGAYYVPGAMVSYRFNLYDSNRFGHSHAHLASVRVKDPGGSGSTRLWVGRGTSLYEVDLPGNPTGRFTSVALMRSQPIGGGVALEIGLNRAWYDTPTGSYRGTGLVTGLSFSGAPF